MIHAYISLVVAMTLGSYRYLIYGYVLWSFGSHAFQVAWTLWVLGHKLVGLFQRWRVVYVHSGHESVHAQQKRTGSCALFPQYLAWPLVRYLRYCVCIVSCVLYLCVRARLSICPFDVCVLGRY